VAKLKSRKFWLAVTSAILIIVKEGLGIDVDATMVVAFVSLILGYIFVEGSIDVVSRIKGGK